MRNVRIVITPFRGNKQPARGFPGRALRRALTKAEGRAPRVFQSSAGLQPTRPGRTYRSGKCLRRRLVGAVILFVRPQTKRPSTGDAVEGLGIG